MRSGLLETQHDESGNSFLGYLGGGSCHALHNRRIGSNQAFDLLDLVFQIDHDTLGRFRPDTLDSSQGPIITCGNHTDKFSRLERRENHPRRVRTNTGDRCQQKEKLTLDGFSETEEEVGIFTDDLIDKDLAFVFALKGGEGRQGDIDFVADAIALQHHAGGGEFSYCSFYIFYHVCFILSLLIVTGKSVETYIPLC